MTDPVLHSVEPARRWLIAAAAVVACACVINAYTFALASANPLIQSDVWRYLDGFLGRFIENGFSWRDLFTPTDMNDANMPLHKLVLFFHTRFLGMDFTWEAAFATLCCVAIVALLARAAAARPISTWRAQEYCLLAALALSLLSLNSPNIYAWPRATMWYLPLLLACAYTVALPRVPIRTVAGLSFGLGILLLEFAWPIAIACLLALRFVGGATSRRWLLTVLAALAGLAMAWTFYRVCAWYASELPMVTPLPRSFSAFADAGIWQALLLPLADSVVQEGNLQSVFGGAATGFGWALATLLLMAHAWFWWRVARATPTTSTTAVHLAVALMLLYYGLVCGILIQRVGLHGFGYLHQPRYVLFYQLNLAALALLVYAEMGREARGRRALTVLALVVLASFGLLQVRLSYLAWTQVRYSSRYFEQLGMQMGYLADHPDAELECLPLLTLCKFPIEARKRIMGLLVRERLNVFSPGFQTFHRLYPDRGAAPPEPDFAH